MDAAMQIGFPNEELFPQRGDSITYFVNKVRTHFNVRSLWLINRIIGGILLLMAIVGLVMGVKDYILIIE